MIDIKNLTDRIGGRILLENVTLHLPSHGKMGLIGGMDAGKQRYFKSLSAMKIFTPEKFS
jgi:ABC-type hemin transport system ATPase subunit